ncbi:MAG: hypothetical protein IKH47_02655 [Bacteroidaceae bacterium]|nr:hypothetical protein [Bacteroidaceae bacterium]
MKKALFFVFVFVFVNVFAEDYGIKVGGVSVTSSNCNNVTGDKITAYNSGQSYSVKYNPSTKTLTLKNVRIDRTGSGNRAIYNTGCDGLTVIMDGPNYFLAQDAAPLRFEKNTTIKCRNVTSIMDCQVHGTYEDAIYITSGATLTLDSAALYIKSTHSCGIVGKNATENIVMKNSSVWIMSTNNNSSDIYTIWDIASLTLDNTALRLDNDKNSPVKNLKAFSDRGLTILPHSSGSEYKSITYSSDQKRFVYSSNNAETDGDIIICSTIPINQSYFPDEVFRNYLRSQSGGADGYLTEDDPLALTGFINDELSGITSLSLSGKGITSLKGIQFLTSVTRLYADNNSISSLDLSRNTELTEVWCKRSKIKTLTLPAGKKLQNLYCTKNLLTSLNAEECTGLVRLYCDSNMIASLKLPPSSTLTELKCNKNSLGTLDMTSCTGIREIYCQSNNLQTLTLPSQAPLEKIECQENYLSSLKMPTSSVLYSIRCYGNRIKSNAMMTLLSGLNRINGNIFVIDHDNRNEGNVCRAEHVAAAAANNWKVYHQENGEWTATDGCYEFDLWIGCKQVKHAREKGDGWQFNSSTKTLTLNGANIKGEKVAGSMPANAVYTGIYSAIPGLTIVVTGDSHVEGYETSDYILTGICLDANTTITGHALLSVKGNFAICQKKDTLTICGDSDNEILHLVAEGYYCGLGGEIDDSDDEAVYLSTLRMKDEGRLYVEAITTGTSGSALSGIERWNEIILEGRVDIIRPSDAYINKQSHRISGRSTRIIGETIQIDNTTPQIYKLTYLINGVPYKTLEVNYGTAITPLDDIEDDDYYYTWADEPDTMPHHDVDVHAIITSIAPLLSGGAGGRPVNVYYDLQGRKVKNPQKGHIYIVNGKKVVK